MKRQLLYTVRTVDHPSTNYALLKLVTEEAMPECQAGQFVQVLTRAQDVMLRRPISICKSDSAKGELWLLVRDAGRGTHRLCELKEGDTLDVIIPLGNGWSAPTAQGRVLLVGGGVGVAPLLKLGIDLKAAGITPEYVIGARSKTDLLLIDEFAKLGPVNISTDDGSYGTPGLVTQNPSFDTPFSQVYCCGPKPMMMAVGRLAQERGAACQVSLENMMACGLGACLCCVEKTKWGNQCVCTSGPVFDINFLNW